MNIEQEITKIKERNQRVEADKAWETSKTRSGLILAITYVIASLTLCIIGNSSPLTNAIIPTLGFFLSVQSFPIVKRWWTKKYASR